MKHKFLYITCLLAMVSNGVAAQKQLTIGDKMPDIVLNNIVNYKSGSATISDFKDKLLILDFWATWCGPCVAEFPKLDSLQHVFGNQIQMLAVTDQPENIVNDFFAKFGKVKHITPRPSVTSDTLLNNMFKHSYIPHFVWIGRDGKVVAITDADHVTGGNIRSYLEGTAFSLPQKNDNLKMIDRSQTVFSVNIPVYKKEENGSYLQSFDSIATKDMLVHSTFTKYITGLPGIMNNLPARITCLNATIENLFSAAFGKFGTAFVFGSRVIWEVKDPSLQLYRNDELYKTNKIIMEAQAWRQEHTFCYELQAPFADDRNKNYVIMQNDLNNYFGTIYNIQGSMEKRSVKCLALIRTSSSDKVALKDPGAAQVEEGGMVHLKVVNRSMGDVIENLRNTLQGFFLPLVDETAYQGKVDIELNGELDKLDVLNAQLAKYDLKLVEKESVLDMVIVKNRPHTL